MYRDWLFAVLRGTVDIRGVAARDRDAASAVAAEIGIIPHWHVPAVAVVQAPEPDEPEPKIKGHELTLGGGHCVSGVRLPL